MTVWMCQTLGFYGFMSWVPTLLAEHGFSIVRSLEQSSAMSIGAVPGAWIASRLSDRWERKSLIAIVAVVIATCGMSYGLSFRTTTIVIFGFLVAMGQQVFAALLYAYTPECFPTQVRNTGTGVSYGMGRLANGLSVPSSSRICSRATATRACSPTSPCAGRWSRFSSRRSVRRRAAARSLDQRVAVARASTTDDADDIES